MCEAFHPCTDIHQHFLFVNRQQLTVTHEEPGFVVMELPNGDLVEILGDDSPYNIFFTHPVAGFLVDDIAAARAARASSASCSNSSSSSAAGDGRSSPLASALTFSRPPP